MERQKEIKHTKDSRRRKKQDHSTETGIVNPNPGEAGGILSEHPECSMVLLTPDFWHSGSRNCDRINFYAFSFFNADYFKSLDCYNIVFVLSFDFLAARHV